MILRNYPCTRATGRWYHRVRRVGLRDSEVAKRKKGEKLHHAELILDSDIDGHNHFRRLLGHRIYIEMVASNRNTGIPFVALNCAVAQTNMGVGQSIPDTESLKRDLEVG